MSIRARIISFFGILAVVLFAGGLYFGLSSGKLGSSAEITGAKTPATSDIELTLNDHVRSISVGSKAVYSITVKNSSNDAIAQDVRLVGYLAVPNSQSGQNLVSKLTSWFGIFYPQPKISKDHFVGMNLGNLPPKSSLVFQIPVDVVRYSSDQNTLYARVILKMKIGEKRPFWELLSLSRASYRSANVASAEDVDALSQ